MSVGGIGGAGGANFDAGFDAASAAPAAPGEIPWSGPSSSVFDRNADIDAVGRGDKEIARGERGPGVRGLQDALIVLGKLPRSPGADGIFGQGTERALAQFQRESGLTPSGRLDKGTLEALDRKLTNNPAGGAAPAARTSALPAPDPLRNAPASYLRDDAERNVYRQCKDLLFTGASWTRGLDAAVTDRDALGIMDKLETLPPASYNRVLHALAATKESDPFTPTLLDKFIVRGTSQFGGATLSDRFCEQLKRKCESLGDVPENKILRHVSPDSVDRLKGWANWAKLIDLFA